jgi:phenylalanyl-tRNA synthetase beta subunit
VILNSGGFWRCRHLGVTQADVGEILRVYGYNHVALRGPAARLPLPLILTPTKSSRQNVARLLVGRGFPEIITNSITNAGTSARDGPTPSWCIAQLQTVPS